MADYLKAACAYVGTTPDKVLVHRVDEAEQVFVLVVDNGIAGCPKYTIPLAELIATVTPVEAAAPAAETEAPKAARTRKKK